MKLSRRQFLYLAAGAAALPFVSREVAAQKYPSRPVRIIGGFPPGGTADIVARLMGQWLSERLGQPIVVENRPGAGGNIGAEAAVRAARDGYTLLLAASSNAINATVYDQLSFNFIRDITPVAGISRNPFVMEVNPSIPARTIPEFIAYAKANPGKVNMASAGNGTPHHVCGELFKMMTGVNMLHVPYRGEAPALFTPTGASIEYLRSGKLRPLAVTTSARLEVLPDVPTVGEFVPGYEASGWFGVSAPKNTPAEIVEKLNKEINAGLADPTMKARLMGLGIEPMLMTPAEFEKFIADDTEKWAKVVKFARIKAG
jgi:tripartite-type tricarboxylate transporter receptor subunit TctC